jgi:murein DD-endopeptidase MepM/ murein hydrolase activator NlpD
MSRRRAILLLLAVTAGLALPATGAAARDVSTLKQQVQAFQQKSDRMDALAGAAAVRHNAALDAVEQARSEAAASRRALVRTRAALTLGRQRLADRLVALYRHPDPELIELIVQSGSLTDLVSEQEALRAAAGDDARMVSVVRARQVELVAAQGRLARAITTAEAEEKVVAREAARVQALARAQRARLDSAKGALRAELRSRRAGTARAAAAVGAADPVLASPGTEPVFPVAAPTTFSDDWLQSRGGGRLHEGIDLVSTMGAPLVATVSGTILRPGNTPRSGIRLWIRGNNGDEYFYCHLSRFASNVRDGLPVKAGDVVGYVGMTGDAQGTVPHLHFEIHPGGGGPIRPYPLVSTWPRVG